MELHDFHDKDFQARMAVIKAGLDVVTVDVDSDYIETICPVCNTINCFHFSELEQMYCEHCSDDRHRQDFEEQSRRLVTRAGFSLIDVNYEEDDIEIECPICQREQSLSFRDLRNISCKFCYMKTVAQSKGFDLYWYDEIDTPEWEEEVETWRDSYDATPVVLECKRCGDFQILDAGAENLVEQIRNISCSCSIITPELYRLAHSHGLSIETTTSAFGDYTLKRHEIALCCMRCGESYVLDYTDKNLVEKISQLQCAQNCTHPAHNPDIQAIAQHRIMWCVDYRYGLDYIVRETLNNHRDKIGIKTTQYYIDDTYFTYSPDGKYELTCFCALRESDKYSPIICGVFIQLFQNTISSKGKISLVEPNAAACFCNAIMENISFFDSPSSATIEDATAGLFNGYIHILNDLAEKVAEYPVLLISFDKTYINRQHHQMDAFMKTHRCPVCKRYFEIGTQMCPACGFPELGRSFLNKEDGEMWLNNVVIPARENIRLDWERVYNSIGYVRFDW